MIHVFLDPDGTLGGSRGDPGFGLHLLVQAATGVTYAHQCGGAAAEVRAAEGFLVPVGRARQAEPLLDFFAGRGRGRTDDRDDAWLAELRRLLAEVRCWRAGPDGRDEPHRLSLDEARAGEVAEGWVPVATPYGPGILLFANGD